MRARIPLDVDLEDKLIYGLSPLRFAYVLVAGVAAMAIWSSNTGPSALRGTACVLVAILGAAAGWLRHEGRHLDSWVSDIGAFLLRNYRLELAPARARQQARRGPRSLSVHGVLPGSGATTVTAELAAALAELGTAPRLAASPAAALRLGMTGTGRHPVLDLEVAETRRRGGLEVSEAAGDADIALLVTPADVPLESLRKVAGVLKPPRELVLVINRAPPGREWTELVDAAGAQRAVALPFDPWLAEAERKGEPAFNPVLRGLAAELVRSP